MNKINANNKPNVKIIQFKAMDNDPTWQACILGLGDDGVVYINGANGWEAHIPLKFKLEEPKDTDDSNFIISKEEFMELATFKMTNDDPDQAADMDIVWSVMDKIAVKCLGYDGWIQAYHEIDKPS